MKNDLRMLIKRKLLSKDLAFRALAFYLIIGTCITATASVPIAKTNIVVSRHIQNADIMIRGIVNDENGQPLPGAGIKIKGASTTVAADVNGAFSIRVPNKNTVLVITYVGYETQEITVGTQTTITIQMKPKSGEDLKEIAIVGFGTQKKESLVGAQSSVRVSELKQPVSSLSQMLSGRIPGIINVSRNGEPGATGSDIFIRGVTSLAAGDRGPLIIIDGVPGRDLNDLSVYDIENFTVLKDAAATAVYGIRGANGVIIINTKQGVVGTPKITVDFYQGITRFTRKPQLIDGVDYMNLSNEAKYNEYLRLGAAGAFNPVFSLDAINNTAAQTNPIMYPNVDWFDAIYKDFGQNSTATANLSGGVSNARYYVSLGYYGENGLFKTDEAVTNRSKQRYNRFNVSANLNWDITGTTKLDLGIKGVLGQTNYPSEFSAQDIFSQAFLINPTSFPVLYPNGSLPGISPQADQRNPYGDVTRNGYRVGYDNQLYSNLRLTQDLKAITPGLSLTGMYSFDIGNQNSLGRIKRESIYRINPTDPYITPNDPASGYKYGMVLQGQDYLDYRIGNGGDKKIYAEVGVNYSRTFGKHAVSGLLLYNQNDNVNPFAGNLTLSIPHRLQGIAARATYAYDNRYFAEFNLGYNGSENFAPSERYGTFPAFGLGWMVSNEKFFENLTNTFQMVKLRYSDGIVGSGGSTGGYASNEADRFFYLTKISNTNIPGYTFGQTGNVGLSGLAITAYGVDVTWAETRKQDLGFEFKTFNNGLSVIIDFFKEHRTGTFISRGVVPNYIGLANTPLGNLGEVKNKGIDGTIEYNAQFSQDLSINFRANYTYNKDVVIENDQAPKDFPWMEQRGLNVLSRFGYIAEKLFDSQEEINASPRQFGTLLPGDIKYKDLNGDGEINSFDETNIGRGDIPSSTYGFGFSVTYKNLDFGAFFQGQHNADMLLNIPSFTSSGGLGNMLAVATDRWTVSNPRQDAVYPRLSYNSNNNNYRPSTWWKRDISFLRLKNVDLGYSLKKGIKSIGVNRLRIYATGYNVYTFSKFKLWDPELLTNNGTRYPLTSTYTLGFTAHF